MGWRGESGTNYGKRVRTNSSQMLNRNAFVPGMARTACHGVPDFMNVEAHFAFPFSGTGFAISGKPGMPLDTL
jgi:hypothetical protein